MAFPEEINATVRPIHVPGTTGEGPAAPDLSFQGGKYLMETLQVV